jgi:prepilin-type N-terminal cleavage/methylation domain-containing protein
LLDKPFSPRYLPNRFLSRSGITPAQVLEGLVMSVRRSVRRRGFTLVETLVVIAVIALLIGLLLPAVQKVREAGNRTQCQNNLHQLALATHHYENVNGAMPQYFKNTPQDSSWFIYLMPYLELDNMYSALHAEGSPATGTFVPAVAPVYDYTGCVWIPGTPATPGSYQWVQMVGYNGVVIWTWQWVGGSPGTPGHWEPPPTLVSGGSAAHWEPPGSGPVPPGSRDNDGIHQAVYKVLQCPSDPSRNHGLDRFYGGNWGVTSYSANFLVMGGSTGDGSTEWGNWNPAGYDALPKSFSTIQDGLSNSILFSEVYANCYDRGRIALYTWTYQDFGLTQAVAQGAFDAGTNPPFDGLKGVPNSWMFQVRPDATPQKQCVNCCCPFFAQTPHTAIQVAMADGSVRAIRQGISQQAWNYLMQPADGQSSGVDQ